MQPVANKGDPVTVARQCGNRNHVHVGVNALQEPCCAVQSLLWEGVGVVFANNTQLTVQQKRGIVVAVSNVALDHLLKQVLANVPQALMPKGAVPNVLATQCALRCIRCAHVKPGGLAANCCSEDASAIVQEEHLSALNLNWEAMGSDKVQDSKEVVLECRT
jgi:hypothetical protein